MTICRRLPPAQSLQFALDLQPTLGWWSLNLLGGQNNLCSATFDVQREEAPWLISSVWCEADLIWSA